ncbi:MAG: protein phosphatase CheZ [Deltaproteobacteria bacterium]|nr:protein phosphatase CheZ [Deltaproteobacteria bacterium]
MDEKHEKITNDCRAFLKDLDSNQQAEIAAQLFLEYCVYQDQCENTKRLAPLINTVAEALTRNIKGEDSLALGIKAVQLYLRTPPVEYFGETLIRLEFLDKEGTEEMLKIQPKGKIFGTFLMEQGLISQEQRDIAVMAQKRLFTVQEVHERLVNKDYKGTETNLAETLKGVFQHFLTSTDELEEDLRQSKTENIHHTLQRLEDIISETEKQTNFVLEIIDQIFKVKDEMTVLSEEIRKLIDPADKAVIDYMEKISEKLNMLYSLNMDLNTAQQIQDRIGQQMLKIIPSIKTFHDQLLKIANKLNLNWEHVEPEDDNLTRAGYGRKEPGERVEQGDVDDLLSSLGL